jgi:TolB-like protein
MKKLFFTASIFVFMSMLVGAQSKSVTLDDALHNSIVMFNSFIPLKATTAVVSPQSPALDLSYYIADEITAKLLLTPGRSVIARRNIIGAEKELSINITQQLTDTQALSVGKKLAAQVVVGGWVRKAGANYVLELEAINVQDSKVLKALSYQLASDARLSELTANVIFPVQEQANQTGIVPAGGATGSITITNKDSDHTMTMVKIYKGFEARESKLLVTHLQPIRPEREMTGALPEDDYYVKTFWNDNTDYGVGDQIAVLENNFYTANADRYSINFRRK